MAAMQDRGLLRLSPGHSAEVCIAAPGEAHRFAVVAAGGGACNGNSVGGGAAVTRSPRASIDGAAYSSHLTVCAPKRHCTESMVKSVEQKILDSKRRLSLGDASGPLSNASFSAACLSRSTDCGEPAPHSGGYSCLSASLTPTARCCPGGRAQPDLALGEHIGSGGFASVWRGTWKKLTAAVKILYARGGGGDAMMDAVEMAVLSAVSHPNIVQAYACLTDMVDAGAGAGAARARGRAYALAGGRVGGRMHCMLRGGRAQARLLTSAAPSSRPRLHPLRQEQRQRRLRRPAQGVPAAALLHGGLVAAPAPVPQAPAL